MNLSRYPVVYSVLIIPLSVIRWLGFANEKSGANPTPAEYTNNLAALAVFGLSGFLNTILLLKTKPQSGLFGTPAQPQLGYQMQAVAGDPENA